jgi:hypothetical protein
MDGWCHRCCRHRWFTLVLIVHQKIVFACESLVLHQPLCTRLFLSYCTRSRVRVWNAPAAARALAYSFSLLLPVLVITIAAFTLVITYFLFRNRYSRRPPAPRFLKVEHPTRVLIISAPFALQYVIIAAYHFMAAGSDQSANLWGSCFVCASIVVSHECTPHHQSKEHRQIG